MGPGPSIDGDRWARKEVTDRSSSRARAVGVPADLRGRGTAPESVDHGDGFQPAGPRATAGAGPSAWGLLAQPPTSRLVERHLQRVRRQLSDPLTANGYALIANSGATGALGLVYWLFMARLYPTAAVGRASAIYAAMNLLAGFTAESFNGALNRFIPQAGLRTRSFILRAYTVSTVGSVALAILFVLTAGWWGTSYSELNGPIIGTVFVCSVAAWAIFTLQDSVLVGLRAASWVLVENGLFGVVKLLLLIALVAALPFHLGIYVSWMVPAVVALPLINVLIFGHLVPRHTLLTRDFQPASNRQIGRFLAGDYSGALCMLATGSLIPVVVASSIGARQTAYFYIAWVIVGIVDMVGISMAMSLTVEGAFDANALAANCRAGAPKDDGRAAAVCRAARRVRSGLVGPVRPAYAAQGTDVLRLLTLATVCRAPTELYLGVLRAESRTARVALVQVFRAAITLGLTVALTGVMGTLGAAVAVATTRWLRSCSPPPASGGCSGQTMAGAFAPKRDSSDDPGDSPEGSPAGAGRRCAWHWHWHWRPRRRCRGRGAVVADLDTGRSSGGDRDRRAGVVRRVAPRDRSRRHERAGTHLRAPTGSHRRCDRHRVWPSSSGYSCADSRPPDWPPSSSQWSSAWTASPSSPSPNRGSPPPTRSPGSSTT